MEKYRRIESIFAIVCLLVSCSAASDDRGDKKTYVVRYKNGEQTIPVTVVLDYTKQTEYVINMNSRTPSKSVTLYDFKQRTIAYKDLSNQECFLGRLTHETINNESHTLQLLKNPVDSKPLVLSMDSRRPALTPTEIRNIAGQKTAVFCRKMNTWLLSPIKIHERRKRSEDHVTDMHSRYVHQPEKLTVRRARIERNQSSTRSRTNSKAVPNLLSAPDAPLRHDMPLPKRPVTIQRSFLRHHGQTNRNRSHRYMTDSVHENTQNNRTVYENYKEDQPKAHADQTSESNQDINLNAKDREDNGLTRFHASLENGDERAISAKTHSSQFRNSNSKDRFNITDENDLLSIKPTRESLISRSRSKQQLFRRLEIDDNEELLKQDNNRLFKAEKEHNTHESRFREREDLDDSESQFKPVQTYESDINLVNSFDPETHDTNLTEFHFERLRSADSNVSTLRSPNHRSFNEKVESDAEVENYLPVLRGSDVSTGIQTFEDIHVDYPVLKRDYYAPSYLFPESREMDHQDELKGKAPLQGHSKEIDRAGDNDLVADPDSFIVEGLLSTEDPKSSFNAILPHSTAYKATSRSSTEFNFSPSAVHSVPKHGLDFNSVQQLPFNSLQYHDRYNKNNAAETSRSSNDYSQEQFSSSTESTFARDNYFDAAQGHRSDISSEVHNRGYEEPTEKIRQRNLPQIPNVTINEGFPPHQRRIQNVLRLFTPDEIVIDIERLPTVEAPRNVAGFQRRPTLTAPFPTRRMPSSTGRSHGYNKVKTRNKNRDAWKNGNSINTRLPHQNKFSTEVVRRQHGKESITYHVRQDTRLHHQLNNLPPGVSMHPRHPQAPFAEFAQNNKRPFVVQNGHNDRTTSGHRQRHWKHQSSCCQGNSLSSCCRNSMRRGNRAHHRKAPILEDGFYPISDSRQQPSYDLPGKEKVVSDSRDRCQREKMCRTLYQSTQQVLVCRNVKIEGC